MNITELARRLNATPEELYRRLPELGFSIGRRAIKVDNRIASQIQNAWSEMRRRERLKERMEAQKATQERKEVVKDKNVTLPPVLTVREFAERLQLPIARVMQELMRAGILASLNENIDFDTAAILAGDLGYEATREATTSETSKAEEVEHQHLEEVLRESRAAGSARSPVVVVMGHVDHGKTKLLDAIRKTDVVATEAGGITQHIGAYQVEYQSKEGGKSPLTFIDTPGHEAFTVMRSRGAKVADIAILVIAADDGIRPQTIEALDIILAAKMPFVVAINKIDVPGADVQRVLTQLSERNLLPDEWGGKVITVPLSAKQGTNIDKLLDMVLLVAEMEKETISANPATSAVGTIIDSHIDKGQGPVATVLVQSGTLRVGDVLGIRGVHYGKVRAMKNWRMVEVKEAPPSTPVKVLGWKTTPSVGDIMEVAENEKILRREKFEHSAGSGQLVEMTASKISGTTEQGEKKLLPVLVKADVLGSLEALLGLFDRIEHPDVGVTVVSRGLGNVTESDVQNAEASHAIVYAFGVAPTPGAEAFARDKKVELFVEKIIYKIVEDVLRRLQEMLPDAYVIRELGDMEVLAAFRKIEHGWIVGGRLKNGTAKPGAKMRMFRGTEIIGEGSVLEMKTGARVVKSVQPGEEFGISYKGKVKAEPGDRVEFYEEEYQGRKLEIPGFASR
ncbi:translation initiation factor IF-2 [Candidatus Uhrbacteria bacterium]|nr:translation initiation factor IF-2 [Candidatus Uhrbacteria bacterium]